MVGFGTAVRVGLAVVVGSAVWLVPAGSVSAASIANVSDAAYTPLAPCVVFDTRPSSGAVEPYQGPLAAGEAVAFQVTGSFPADQ
ncbi:MAG: hypothetical protein JJD92_12580, partial [Frankiaceae bacterium]|nr:hypothetical protein [Frankiaceae bacterium]